MASVLRPLAKITNSSFVTNSLRRITLGSNMEGAVQGVIRKKLENAFQPNHLEIVNESHKHNVPKGSETHFKVVIVSENFRDKMLVKRHQMVYEALKDEIKNGVHALSIVANTPDQWKNSDKKFEPSPPCLGGSKR